MQIKVSRYWVAFLFMLIMIPFVIKFKTLNKVKEITLSAVTIGIESTRTENLVSAAEKLNEELRREGKNIKVRVEPYSFMGGWEDYAKYFIKRFEENNAPDIYVTGHENIAWLAEKNYIIKLDMLKESKAYNDVFGTLWKSVMWNGSTWGVPQDVEVAFVMVNVNILRKLGWSESDINTLPNKVIKGDFTLDDMTLVANEAVDKKVAKWGILHRPVNGQMFYLAQKNFDVQVFDESKSTIIINRDNLLNSLSYFYQLTNDYQITPKDTTLKSWEDINQMVIDGETLFYYGAIWSIYEYIKQGAEYQELMKQFDFMLVPTAIKGNKPLTISHPLIYTVSSQTENKELVTRLLEIVGDSNYQSKHAVKTYHLPINKSGIQTTEFIDNQFLNSVMYMLDYTTFLPNDEKYVAYSKIYFEAIQNVEGNDMLPEQALIIMERHLRKTFGTKIIFK